MKSLDESLLFTTDQELSALIMHSENDPQTMAKLRSMWGDRAMRIGEICRYLHEATSIVPPLPYPPSWFICYRWESEEIRAWVRKLATGLRNRGLRIILDQWENQPPDRVNVPRLISRIGRCHKVLFILTPEFHTAVSTSSRQPSWVFYEFYVACLLSWYRALEINSILRKGDCIPEQISFRPVIDFRNDTHFTALLDRHFSYGGPIVDYSSPAQRIWDEICKLLYAALYQDAERLLLDAVKTYPGLPIFWSHLGFARIQQGRSEEADEALAQASRLDEEDIFTLGLVAERAYALRDEAKARELVFTILAQDPAEPRAHFIMGNLLDDKGAYQEALRHFKIHLACRPGSVAGMNNYGMVYIHLGQYDEAIKIFDRAIKISPHNLLAMVNRANALRLKGHVHSAVQACREILALKPDYGEAKRLLSFLTSSKG